MELSKKRQIFSGFFSAFLKCRENFEHFQKKKDDLYRERIFELTYSEKRD